jgi:hypothetical protein
MPSVDEVRSKVQRILQNKGLHIELKGEEFWVPYQTTRCRISVRPFGDKTVVDLAAVVIGEVKVTSKLKEYIGERSAHFVLGNIALLHIDGQKDGIVIFRHAILGDFLDEDELMTSLAAVVTTADELDEQLQKMFGGRRAID